MRSSAPFDGRCPGSPALRAFHEAWSRSGLAYRGRSAPREGERRAESGRDRGARGAVRGTSRGRERPTSLALSPAEASRGVVKRRSLRSRSTARKTPEARVLVVNVLGSRRRSDASSVARRGEPQGRPVARASPREVVTPLVRVARDRRRNGALKSRRFNPMTRGGPFGRWACESCTQHQRVWTRRKAPRVSCGLLTGDPFGGNARRPRLKR